MKIKERGITLLALIITIVLLLIISGVTLNIAIGDNGLFKKSQEAVNKGKLAQIEELIKMDLLSAYIDAELLGMDKPSTETIKKIVENYGGTIDESNPNIIQTPNGEINLDKILGETSSDTKDPDEINKTIESLNNRITELNKELEIEKNEKKELQNQVTELNTQVAEWKRKAEDGEITIEEKNIEISNLNNEITTKNQELDEKNNEIQELNENVTTITSQKGKLENQVANLENEIKGKDETIANQNTTIEEKTAKINELNTTVTSLNTRIEELNTSLTDLNGQLDTERANKETLENQVTDLTGQVASWKKKAEDGETTIAQRDSTISSLNDQITQKNADITAKAQTINDLNEQITTLTNQKSSLEGQVSSLNTQVANLQKKQATGNATAANVLAGKTFSNSSGVGLTGTMVNRGSLNYSPDTSTSLNFSAGYYSGGTFSTEKAYKAGQNSIKVTSVTVPVEIVDTSLVYTVPCDFYEILALRISSKRADGSGPIVAVGVYGAFMVMGWNSYATPVFSVYKKQGQEANLNIYSGASYIINNQTGNLSPEQGGYLEGVIYGVIKE